MQAKFKLKITQTLAIGVLVGCAIVQPYVPISTSEKRVIDKNYAVGREQSAYVGSPMVRVNDYIVRNSPSNLVRADKAFSIYAPPVANIEVPAGSTINIIGTTYKDGVNYRLVMLPQVNTLSFLIREDGTFEGSALNSSGARMGWTYTPNPPNAKLTTDSTDVVETSKGDTNFELVYGGTSGDSIQILYREYTQNDLARPAFSQQLMYSKASKRFRFRDFQIDVKQANNESITYTVISDGLQ